MKNQNRIAQRIINVAKAHWKAHHNPFFATIPPFYLNNDLPSELLDRLGANRPKLELGAVVWFEDNGNIQKIDITITTFSSPRMEKKFSFDMDFDMDSLGLGEKIGWLVEQVVLGKNLSISMTPEQDYQDYCDEQEREREESWLKQEQEYEEDWN